MATLKEFEEALREQGLTQALDILERLRARDRATRTIRPARRVVGKKMTPDLAHAILELHATTEMTQQEIAFRLGVNQGRVNEVIKRGKWLSGDPTSEEARSRDRAMAKMERQRETRRRPRLPRPAAASPHAPDATPEIAPETAAKAPTAEPVGAEAPAAEVSAAKISAAEASAVRTPPAEPAIAEPALAALAEAVPPAEPERSEEPAAQPAAPERTAEPPAKDAEPKKPAKSRKKPESAQLAFGL